MSVIFRMRVKFNDLGKATGQVRNQFLKEASKLIGRGSFILTPEVKDFENDWAKAVGAKYAVGVSSGTDALYLAFAALGIGVGDEVITQGNAYNASVTAILRAGAIPRFADINPETLALDANKIEPLINKKTKAILPVHLYGQACDMETVSKIAKKHKLKIVEDCAQAHLASFKGKQAGVWGDIGAFSFYPTKNLGAFGDAGAVTTNDKKIYEKILALRDLGQVAKNDHGYLGFNMRLDPIQAILLKLKLPYLKANTKERQETALYYGKLFSEAGIPVVPVSKNQYAGHVYHLYVVRALKHKRDWLRGELKKLGVETAVHYPLPVYNQPFFSAGGLAASAFGGKKFRNSDKCPITDLASKQIFSLPFFLGITKPQQKYVVESLKKVLS